MFLMQQNDPRPPLPLPDSPLTPRDRLACRPPHRLRLGPRAREAEPGEVRHAAEDRGEREVRGEQHDQHPGHPRQLPPARRILRPPDGAPRHPGLGPREDRAAGPGPGSQRRGHLRNR